MKQIKSRKNIFAEKRIALRKAGLVFKK